MALVKLGHENDKIVVLDADLSNATMTMNFAREFPNRHFDVGIAEANMVDMAAGMSTMGLIPFCSTFAVFAGRSYDQIRNGAVGDIRFVRTYFYMPGGGRSGERSVTPTSKTSSGSSSPLTTNGPCANCRSSTP